MDEQRRRAPRARSTQPEKSRDRTVNRTDTSGPMQRWHRSPTRRAYSRSKHNADSKSRPRLSVPRICGKHFCPSRRFAISMRSTASDADSRFLYLFRNYTDKCRNDEGDQHNGNNDPEADHSHFIFLRRRKPSFQKVDASGRMTSRLSLSFVAGRKILRPIRSWAL